MIRAHEIAVIPSMTAIEFVVPPVALEGKVATDPAAGGDQALDAEMAALAGMWAAIFQQQILPQAEPPAGETIPPGGLGNGVTLESGDLEAGAAAAATLGRERSRLPGQNQVGEPASLPVQALANLLSRLVVPLEVPTAVSTSKGVGTPETQLLASSPDVPTPAAAGTVDSSSPASLPGMDELAKPSSILPPDGSPEPRMPLQHSPVSDSGWGETQPERVRAQDVDPARAATPIESAKPGRPASESPLPLVAALRGESAPASPVRPSSARKVSSGAALIALSHSDPGSEPVEIQPALITEVSLRKRLADPVHLNQRPPMNVSAVDGQDSEHPSIQSDLPLVSQSTGASSPEEVESDPVIAPLEAGVPQPSASLTEDRQASAPMTAATDAQPTREPAADITREPAVQAPPASPAESRRVEAQPRFEGAPKPPERSAAPRRADFEAPAPLPGPPRETKTISIRIPLTDSRQGSGSPTRHLDLVFAQKNNDLTLQFQSPSAEIQRNIEESMPSLLDRLRTENWTSPSPDTSRLAQSAEPLIEFRRRVESFTPSSASFEGYREAVAPPPANSQGFSFDDAPQQHKGNPEQQSQPRNPKRDADWRDELDQQLES